MILFNRWIIARVDRAVKRAESPVCNGWILTDQDDGFRCMRPVNHEGFCDAVPSVRTAGHNTKCREHGNEHPDYLCPRHADNYAAKSYAFGVGPKPERK